MADDMIQPSSQPFSQLFGRMDFKGASVKIDQNMYSSYERTKDKKEIIPPTLLKGLSIQTFWSEVWSNNTTLLNEYHANRREKDIVCSKWEMHPDKASGYRVVTLQTIVEVPRANTYTLLHEAHRFAFSTSDNGKLKLIYHISSQTPDVPAGTTFRCETLMEVTADSLDTDCTVVIFANTKKMSMAFAAIQFIATPRAVRELQAGYVKLLGLITERLCGESLQIKPTLSTPTPEPAEAPMAAAAPAAGDVQGAKLVVPSWAVYTLIALALVSTIVVVWSFSTVYSANHSLDAIVQNLRSSASTLGPSGIPTQGDTPLWDSVDRELDAALEGRAEFAASSSSGPSSSANNDSVASTGSPLTKGQLLILSRQEALLERALSSIGRLASRQESLEQQHSWLWTMWLAQLLVLVVVVVKTFLA